MVWRDFICYLWLLIKVFFLDSIRNCNVRFKFQWLLFLCLFLIALLKAATWITAKYQPSGFLSCWWVSHRWPYHHLSPWPECDPAWAQQLRRRHWQPRRTKWTLSPSYCLLGHWCKVPWGKGPSQWVWPGACMLHQTRSWLTTPCLALGEWLCCLTGTGTRAPALSHL